VTTHWILGMVAHTPNETFPVTLVIRLLGKVGGGTMCYAWS